MVKILSSRVNALGNKIRTNKAFGKIFGSVTKNQPVAKRRKIFEAFKSQVKGAVTKDTVRHAFSAMAKKGISKKDMLRMSGEVLKGESAGSRLRYVNDAEPTAGGTANTIEQKPVVDMGKVMQEIIDKKKPNPDILAADVQKNDRSESEILDFGISNKNLRNAEQILTQTNNETEMQNRPSSVLGYIESRKSKEGIDKVKSTLARIQENPDEDEKTDLTE